MLRAQPEGRTYTIAVYIATLIFILAGIILVIGILENSVPEAITQMAAAFAALGAVAGAYGIKAGAQHWKGTATRPDAAQEHGEPDEPR